MIISCYCFKKDSFSKTTKALEQDKVKQCKNIIEILKQTSTAIIIEKDQRLLRPY